MSSPPPPESGQGKDAAEAHVLKKVKPEPGAAGGEADGAHINIKVTSQTAPDAFFRVKRDILMERIIEQYCDEYSLDPKAVLFLNEEGTHIRAAQTAAEAGLEDGSSIDVHMAQQGGSGRTSV